MLLNIPYHPRSPAWHRQARVFRSRVRGRLHRQQASAYDVSALIAHHGGPPAVAMGADDKKKDRTCPLCRWTSMRGPPNQKGTYLCAQWGCTRGVSDKKAAESKPNSPYEPVVINESKRSRSPTPPPGHRERSPGPSQVQEEADPGARGADTVESIDALIKEEKAIISANRNLTSSCALNIIAIA